MQRLKTNIENYVTAQQQSVSRPSSLLRDVTCDRIFPLKLWVLEDGWIKNSLSIYSQYRGGPRQPWNINATSNSSKGPDLHVSGSLDIRKSPTKAWCNVWRPSIKKCVLDVGIVLTKKWNPAYGRHWLSRRARILALCKKNPAYGRHQLSRPMRIVGPIQI